MSIRSLYHDTFVKKNKSLNISVLKQRIWITKGYVKEDKRVLIFVPEDGPAGGTATA